MVERKIKEKITINEEKPFLKLYLIAIILITIVVTSFRVATYFIPLDKSSTNLFMILMRGRDIDFVILRHWMDNGLFGMYNPPPGYIFGHFYLYHWYFIFLPFYYLPLDISVYIWDVLRLVAVVYVAINVYKITKEKKNLILFLVFSAIGYAVDMSLNNTNWLIQLLLFESYLQLKKERKVLSGILFTLATFKIIVIFFPFILIITKRIKIKEILYYLFPFFILMIPYIINPPYFLQMVDNWTASREGEFNTTLGFLYAILKVFEPAQLMFVSFGVFIFCINIKDETWKNRAFFFALLVLITMFVFYLVLMGTFTRAPT